MFRRGSRPNPVLNPVLKRNLRRGGEADPYNALIFKEKMARPERFERPTPRFVVWCSIQLSYGRASEGGQ